MLSQQPTEVYLAADGEVAVFVRSAMTAYGGLRFCGVCAPDERPAKEDFAGCVVLLQCSVGDTLDYYVKSGAKVVALCNSVGDGFAVLNRGAKEMIALPSEDIIHIGDREKAMFAHALTLKIRSALSQKDADDRVLKKDYGNAGAPTKIIVIGSSTGGTEALVEVVKRLPANCPPVLVVQHMPPVFTRLYAERLHKAYAPSCWEAKDGDKLRTGLIFIAPGDKHMTLERLDGDWVVRCRPGERVNGHCPSCDVMFNSVAETELAAGAIGVILTGMGGDGAQGMLNLRQRGAFCIGQDEKSCVVYGMPKVAFDIGALNLQEDVTKIAGVVMSLV